MAEMAHRDAARRDATRVAKVAPALATTLATTLAILGAAGCGPSRAASFADADAETTEPAGDAIAADAPDGANDAEVGAVPLSPVLADWPLVKVGVESREVTSFDRAGGNDDGFSGRDSALYVDDDGEQVIFDALGPGRLDTLWFTSAVSGTAPLALGLVRFTVDDGALPAASVDADQLFAGGAVGFPSSLVFDNHRSTGGFVSFTPITFGKRLKITTATRASFYSAQYETFPVDTPTASWTPSAPLDAWGAALAASTVDDGHDGAEVPLDTTLPGPGLVTKLTFLPAAPTTRDVLRAARVRIWWDDEADPGVDCPVDAFFGSGLGEAKVSSIAFTMAPGRWVNHLPMPFWRRARVQVTGVAGRLFLRVGPNPYDAARAAHLRVAWRAEAATTEPDDFEYLTYEGAGRLVATVLTVEPANPAVDKQWWEGDLRSYADGRRTPSVHGTGYEDDQFGGWSNEFFEAPFSLPQNGEPAAQILDRNGQDNGNVTMYRVWTGIPFLREIRHSVEHGSENARVVAESAATFFYAEPRPWLVDSDVLAVCDDAARAAHTLTVAGETLLGPLTSAFEGRGYKTPVTMCHHAHTGPATFKLAVAPANEGVVLRRAFDQAVGRQRARVSVGGRPVGTWLVAEQNTTLRWAERDFFIPAAFTAGATTLAISIAPEADPAGSPPPAWDAAEYRALSVVPPSPE